MRLRRTGVQFCNLLAYYEARRLRGAFCGQFVYWCFRFRIRSRPERTHASYLLIIYLWCRWTCSILSTSCDISHDIGIEISQTYYRSYWYRYIAKILHGISRILDTIPTTSSKQFRTSSKQFRTSSKQFRTHAWGYASLPASWIEKRLLLLYT